MKRVTKKQIIEFIEDYLTNDGCIIEKYNDTDRQIAEEWRELTILLDGIR